MKIHFRLAVGVAMSAALASTVQAGTGDLSSYAGKYAFDRVGKHDFIHDPVVVDAVQRAAWDLTVRREALSSGPTTPIRRIGALLAMDSCRAHDCAKVNWVVAVRATNAAGKSAAVCYHDEYLMGDVSVWFWTGLPRLRTRGRCNADAISPAITTAIR